jgi:hypothetical protein
MNQLNNFLLNSNVKENPDTNRLSDRNINQDSARISNLINQKQIPDPNQSVHKDFDKKQR